MMSQRRVVLRRVGVSRTFVPDADPRECLLRPVHVVRARALLRRLDRDGGLVIASFPASPVLRGHLADLLRLHVAHYQHGRVFGTVVARKELLRVRELVGHVLDVLKEAHRRVLVGVLVERRVAEDLVQLADGRCRVLVVLAQHRQRLCAEHALRGTRDSGSGRLPSRASSPDLPSRTWCDTP